MFKMNKPNYTVLNDIVKVKNATLIFDYTKQVYSLVHYDTEIALITKDNQILKALKCTSSSTRAIYQLTDYLGIDRKTVKNHLELFTNFDKVKTNILGKDLR